MIPFSALKELTIISAVLQRVEIFSIDRLIFSPRIFFGKFILVSFQIPILLNKNLPKSIACSENEHRAKHVDIWSCEHYFSYPWENVAYVLKNTRLKRSVYLIFLVNICIGIFENCWLFFNLFLSLESFLTVSEIHLLFTNNNVQSENELKITPLSGCGVGKDPKPRLVKCVTELGCSLLGNFTQLSFSHWLFPHAIGSHAY